MNDVNRLVNYCDEKLDLKNAELSEEYFYQSVPLCVIDAVFSIGVNYQGVRNIIARYCEYFNLKKIRDSRESIPLKKDQQSVLDFLLLLDEYGVEKFTEEVFNNRQRTSPVNGILKTEAVYRFSQVLKDFKVDFFQDIGNIIDNKQFEREIRKIPGQRSGISLRYFFMLAGYDKFIKPDRMILGFLHEVLNKKVDLTTTQKLLVEVSYNLRDENKHITPRLLDYQIWLYMRGD